MNRKNLRRLIGWVIALVILYFLAQTLVSSWAEVQASGFHFTFNWPLLAFSLVLLVIGRGFAVEAWRRILMALGDRVSFRFAFYAWFISNLARYVPGNIWQLAAMMVIVEREGVSKMNVLLSQAVYAAIALSVAVLYGLTLLPVFFPNIFSGNAWFVPLAAVLFATVIVIFAMPPVFRLLVDISDRLLQRFRRTPHIPAQVPPMSFWRGLIPPLCSFMMWTINGIAFYLFVRSITDVQLVSLPSFIAMNAAAYFVGYISFITPSGLGFREGALALMLQAFFPAPLAVAIAFLTRLWSTFGELLGVGIALWGAPRRTEARRPTTEGPTAAVVSPPPETGKLIQ